MQCSEMVDRPVASLGLGGPRGPTPGPTGCPCSLRNPLRSVHRTNSCTSCTPSLPVVPGARRAPGGPDGPSSSTSNITPSRSYTGGLYSTSVQTAEYRKRYQRGIDLPRLFVFLCLFVTLFVFVFNKCKHDEALHTNAVFPFFSA